MAFDIKPAHDVSKPSTETQGQQPREHTDGVGSLPGSKDEQGVALLPEERATETTGSVRPEHREGQLGGPTSNTKHTDVDVGGATDPLKKDSQPKVSLFPRPLIQAYACRSRKGAQRSGRSDNCAIQLEPRVHPLGGDASRWHGVNLGLRATEEWEHAAAFNVSAPLALSLNPPLLSTNYLSKNLETETGGVTPEQKTTRSEPGQQPSASYESDNLGGIQRSTSNEGGVDGQHKATLKEKITGGMKVVTGKLGNDKSKVEEGKKLMHGQSA